MWHESRSEMVGTLKSIFLMDEDQTARRLAEKEFHIQDPDYYEFESKAQTFIKAPFRVLFPLALHPLIYKKELIIK